MTEPTSGLYAQDRPIPLDGVRIDARLVGAVVEVTVTQRYTNAEAVPLEAVYVFPLEEGAAVCGFAARIGERIVEGRVEEREQAFAAYDDAMADGHGAFLLDQERPNIFTASVGNLKPGETVDVELRYVALATFEGPAARLTIPTTISPRYVPAGEPEVGQPDGERVNPERRFEVPYGLTLTVDVEAPGPVVSVESPSNTVRTRLREHGATVALSQGVTALDRDFVLLVEAEDAHAPHAVIGREEDGTRVCMVSFVPDPEATPDRGTEVRFLLDCSGSMGGDSIAQARRALELCVRALAPEDTFNVTRFGSHHASLWPASRRLDDASLAEAVAWVRASDADLGGTEILAPLTEILGAERDAGRPLQVLLLTDGEVSNEDQVIALAEAHVGDARIFTFGIGAGASEHLVRGVARASRGAAELIYPGERIEGKVLRMFNRVRTPAYTDVRVDWGGMEVEQAPRAVPPVFAGELLTVFARIRAGQTDKVALTAGGRRWEVALDLEHALADGPVPVMWARHAIRDLETGSSRGSSQRRAGAEDAKRARVVELAKRYGLMSSATSYVAVEVRSEDDRTTAPAELRRVPIALTAGWGGHGSVLRHRGFPGAMPPPAPMAAQFSAGAAPPRGLKRKMAAKPAHGFLSAVAGAFKGRFGAADMADAGPPEPAPALEAELHDAFADKTMYIAFPADEEEARKEEAAVTIADRLYALLATQRADGRFGASEALRSWLGDAEAAFDAAVAQHGEAVVATAIALVVFERFIGETYRDEWRPAAKKAQRWLDAQGASFDPATVLG
ncbi:MAG: VWA domain-containing protein [Deltaproteobacteria bacterium]|nr:MAG: VWA domain-containing protein [Deltaproteobacteria bacterium]